MRTLIVYGTKYGCTEKCAALLAEKLTGTVDVRNLKTAKNLRAETYDRIIIGSSVYMGQIRKEVKEFCTANLHLLSGKQIGIFICCMREGELAESELKAAFPGELVDTAMAKGYLGGAFDFKKMNFMERMIVKKVANVAQDTSNIDEMQIEAFIRGMQ